jgi:YD repeat-containing protein
LWIGGRPMYDVNIYDANGRPLGSIGADSSASHEMYDQLRRMLATEDIRA